MRLERHFPYDHGARSECLELLEQVAQAEDMMISLMAQRGRQQPHSVRVTLPEVDRALSTEGSQRPEPLRLLSPRTSPTESLALSLLAQELEMDEAQGNTRSSPKPHRPPPRPAKPVRFEDVDVNGDGVIDRSEYETYRQAQRTVVGQLQSPLPVLLEQPQFREGYTQVGEGASTPGLAPHMATSTTQPRAPQPRMLRHSSRTMDRSEPSSPHSPAKKLNQASPTPASPAPPASRARSTTMASLSISELQGLPSLSDQDIEELYRELANEKALPPAQNAAAMRQAVEEEAQAVLEAAMEAVRSVDVSPIHFRETVEEAVGSPAASWPVPGEIPAGRRAAARSRGGAV